MSWASCSRSGPEVVAGSRTLQISNITGAISKFVRICFYTYMYHTMSMIHECMDSKKLIMCEVAQNRMHKY